MVGAFSERRTLSWFKIAVCCGICLRLHQERHAKLHIFVNYTCFKPRDRCRESMFAYRCKYVVERSNFPTGRPHVLETCGSVGRVSMSDEDLPTTEAPGTDAVCVYFG